MNKSSNQKLGWSFILILFLVGTGCHQYDKETLTVATAANMQFAMKEMLQNFTKTTGIECNMIISSSGKLTAQITEGAPFDIFVSADMKYPDKLFAEGLGIEKPQVYAYGKLVLWSATNRNNLSLETLSQNDIYHVAMANPKTAPYGVAAEETLKKTGLWEKMNDKLVFGESIAQTNQFIVSGSAELGFTAESVVKSPEMKNKGTWIAVDTNLYQPIAQGILLLKTNRSKQKEARQFQHFLFSHEGRGVLKKYGYSVP
ncbi:MAG: molybdate ABC transporter substrate-binding protein [Bacteroidales bacterium]|nr:molybdate ABC transporter substrate-binding protein [Bacteroidales bacterium]